MYLVRMTTNERCNYCGIFTCETIERDGKVFRTIHVGGDIYQREFEIETCELKNDKQIEPGGGETPPQGV